MSTTPKLCTLLVTLDFLNGQGDRGARARDHHVEESGNSVRVAPPVECSERFGEQPVTGRVHDSSQQAAHRCNRRDPVQPFRRYLQCPLPRSAHVPMVGRYRKCSHESPFRRTQIALHTHRSVNDMIGRCDGVIPGCEEPQPPAIFLPGTARDRIAKLALAAAGFTRIDHFERRTGKLSLEAAPGQMRAQSGKPAFGGSRVGHGAHFRSRLPPDRTDSTRAAAPATSSMGPRSLPWSLPHRNRPPSVAMTR